MQPLLVASTLRWTSTILVLLSPSIPFLSFSLSLYLSFLFSPPFFLTSSGDTEWQFLDPSTFGSASFRTFGFRCSFSTLSAAGRWTRWQLGSRGSMDHLGRKETWWLFGRDSGEEGIAAGRQRKSVLLFSRRRGARPTRASGLRYEKNGRESRVEGRLSRDVIYDGSSCAQKSCAILRLFVASSSTFTALFCVLIVLDVHVWN